MAGTKDAALTKAWAAVVLMIVGFTVCTLAFILHNNIPMWIIGGVIGGAGLVTAKLANIMSLTE
ncbi:MAG TPA: hypothetical protein VGN54_13475 [Mycobacteriales bacterium]|jgi:uncharacterized membrane protein YccC|nr:hypothetical protein [Mycobacteriales bacterium]